MPTPARIRAATSIASSCHNFHSSVCPLKKAKRALAEYAAKEVNNSAYPPDLRLAATPRLRYSFHGGPMQAPTVCMQCDLPEERCTCERDSTMCASAWTVSTIARIAGKPATSL